MQLGIFRPFRGLRMYNTNPRLTPWANFYRCSAARSRTPHIPLDFNFGISSKAKNRQLLRAMRAEDEDALNVTRAAWPRDERDHARIIVAVFLLHQGKCRR